jgi:ribonuclease D
MADHWRRPDASGIHSWSGDMPEHVAIAARSVGIIAMDTETTGLDWKTQRIATYQLLVPGILPGVGIVGPGVPSRLASILSDPKVRKVFHHAMFDLRFIANQWGVSAANVACTKIAGKLLDPSSENSLKALVRQHLRIELDKTLQSSDWQSTVLSPGQLVYAATDVAFLVELLNALEEQLRRRNLGDLANACFAHIPARIRLDLLGYPDVYLY